MEEKKQDEKLKVDEKEKKINILEIKLSKAKVILKNITSIIHKNLIKYINILNIYIKSIFNKIKNIK